jgi:hypothetical protein
VSDAHAPSVLVNKAVPHRSIAWMRTRSPLVRGAIAYLGVALVTTAVTATLRGVLGPRTGLVRMVYAEPGFKGEPLSRARTGSIDLAFLDDEGPVPRQGLSVRWEGFWFVPAPRTVHLSARGDGRVDVLVDRALVLRQHTGENEGLEASASPGLRLAAGAHEIIVQYEQEDGGAEFALFEDGSRDPAARIPPGELFASRPSRRSFRLAAVLREFEQLLLVVWVAVPAIVLLVVGARSERIGRISEHNADSQTPAAAVATSHPRFLL